MTRFIWSICERFYCMALKRGWQFNLQNTHKLQISYSYNFQTNLIIERPATSTSSAAVEQICGVRSGATSRCCRVNHSLSLSWFLHSLSANRRDRTFLRSSRISCQQTLAQDQRHLLKFLSWRHLQHSGCRHLSLQLVLRRTCSSFSFRS